MSVPDNFYLSLFSSSLPHISRELIYSAGSLSSFTTSLNPSLFFDSQKYEVGVVQVSGDTKIQNVNNGEEYRVTFILKEDSRYKSARAINITLPNGEYTSAFKIIAGINRQLILQGFKDFYLSVFNFESNKLVNPNLPQDNNLDSCVLKISERKIDKKKYVVRIFNDIVSVKFEGALTNIFSANLSSKLTNPILKDDISNYRLTSFTPKTSRIAHLYTNIIEHQHLGSHKAKLLRSFIIKDEKDTTNFDVEFTHPHYMMVESAHYRSIKIDIKDSNDRHVSFAPDTLLVKLHFRRVESYNG